MRRVICLLCVAVLLLPTLVASSTRHRTAVAVPLRAEPPRPSRQNVIFWYDDIESGENGWTHGDLTADVLPRFHVDTYYAHPDGFYSYWCGEMNEAFAGGDGYGNAWDQRLELPPIPLGGSPVEEMSWGEVKARYRTDSADMSAQTRRTPIVPVLTFAYRHDSELGYDFTWVQAESAGTWVNLDGGYTGSSGGWQSSSGFDLADFGDPLRVRFRFVSDGTWSDEDGLYVSDGGAFHVDNIRVFDFATGEIYFEDDCEDGFGLCESTVPPAAGDWWHIIDRNCPAWSDPHSWWCGDDADTGLIPPGLHNELTTPVIPISYAATCTAHFAIHLAVPQVDNDYIMYQATVDGEDYYDVRTYWGDFGVCDGWGSTALTRGYDVGQFGVWPLNYAGFRFIFHTTDNGCGPGGGGDAGVMIDDFWFEGQVFVR